MKTPSDNHLFCIKEATPPCHSNFNESSKSSMNVITTGEKNGHSWTYAIINQTFDEKHAKKCSTDPNLMHGSLLSREGLGEHREW